MRLCVRWGPCSLLPKNGPELPIFGPCLLWPNGWMHQDATRYGGRPHPRRLCVRWGPSSCPKRGRNPQFSAHVYCGQAAGWIKMVLGVTMRLGPDHIVLDGDPAPSPKKRAEPPTFGPSLLWQNGWMHQDATWYGSRPQPRRLCVRWGSSPLPKKRAEPPIFGPCLLWPNGWMDQDAT